MKSLAEEIVDALPLLIVHHPEGVSARVLSQQLAAPISSVWEVFKTFRATHPYERPVVIADHVEDQTTRGRRSLFLLPLGYALPMREGLRRVACAQCFKVFSVPPRRKPRLCCTRSCSNTMIWTNPGEREKRSASISLVKRQPEHRAKSVETNKRRWAKPGEREKLAERNRQEWRDPAKRARRSAAIQRTRVGAEDRALYSERMKEAWRRPGAHERRSAIAREKCNTPEHRAALAERMRKNWQDPVMRAKYLRTKAEQTEKTAAKARGRKQDPDHAARRTAASTATKRARAAERKAAATTHAAPDTTAAGKPAPRKR